MPGSELHLWQVHKIDLLLHTCFSSNALEFRMLGHIIAGNEIYKLGKIIIAATIFHVNNNELAGCPIASECMVS